MALPLRGCFRGKRFWFFLGGAVSPLSAWLFTKAEGLVWTQGHFCFLHPFGCTLSIWRPPTRPCAPALGPKGEAWGRCGWVGEPPPQGRPPGVGMCGAGWPCFPYKGALLLKGRLKLEKDGSARSQGQVILVNSTPKYTSKSRTSFCPWSR